VRLINKDGLELRPRVALARMQRVEVRAAIGVEALKDFLCLFPVVPLMPKAPKEFTGHQRIEHTIGRCLATHPMGHNSEHTVNEALPAH